MSAACPYRRVHEYDAEGLCAHCYAKAPPPPDPVSLQGEYDAILNQAAILNLIHGPPCAHKRLVPSPTSALSVYCRDCGAVLSLQDVANWAASP